MTKNSVTKFFKDAQVTMSKYGPEILIGIGISGFTLAIISAVRETPKAMKRIEEVKKEENKDELTPMETAKATWKYYAPAATLAVASAACIIGADSKHLKRNAALTAAYKISETALTEYKESVVETIGEKKEREVVDTVAKKKIEKHPVSDNEIIITGKGTTRCFETTSNRYFESDIEQIRRAVNNINHQMTTDIMGYASLNDVYSEFGLSRTEIGDMLGWSAEKGLIDIGFSSHIADDGQPAVVIIYHNGPYYDYDK